MNLLECRFSCFAHFVITSCEPVLGHQLRVAAQMQQPGTDLESKRDV